MSDAEKAELERRVAPNARAYDYFTTGAGKSLSGDRFVLLATDGGPNCNPSLTCTTATAGGVTTLTCPFQKIVRGTTPAAPYAKVTLNLKVANAWGGFIDSTPDGIPVISAVETMPGLYLSTGYSGHGFGIGPGAGHLIADLVSGAEPLVDPRPLHPNRFQTSAWGRVADF